MEVRSTDAGFEGQLLGALTALREGDFSVRLPVEESGITGSIAAALNAVMEQNEQLCSEIRRIARETGREGRFGGQAEVDGVSGGWRELTDDVNEMASHLTNQVRFVSRALTAVAMGHFASPQPPRAEGEMAALIGTLDALRDHLVALQERLPAGRESGVPPVWARPGQPIRQKGDAFWIAWILDDLGAAARERGDYESARSLHVESLTLRRELPGRDWGIVLSLGSLAALAAAQGQAERAARLFGAAEALRERLGRPLPAEEQLRQREAVGAVLGAQQAEAAWAEGRALTPEQAVACALEEPAGKPKHSTGGRRPRPSPGA